MKYSKLFTAIGYTYGGAAGIFNLPALNTNNLFIRGGTTGIGVSAVDTTKVSGISVGIQSANHSHTLSSGSGTAAATTHTHSITDNATHSHSSTTGDTDKFFSHTHGFTTNSGGAHTHTSQIPFNTSYVVGALAVLTTGVAYIATYPLVTDSQGSHTHTGTVDAPAAIPQLHNHSITITSTGGHNHTVNNESSHTHAVTVSSLSLNNQNADHNHTLTGDSETAPKSIKMQYIIKL